MTRQELERKSSALTLSDMEIFVFPELIYSLLLANLMSPRIWRWRALGLSHPARSARRPGESIKGLKAIVAAIKRKDATAAEQLTRAEAAHAAAEVLRLVAVPVARTAAQT